MICVRCSKTFSGKGMHCPDCAPIVQAAKAAVEAERPALCTREGSIFLRVVASHIDGLPILILSHILSVILALTLLSDGTLRLLEQLWEHTQNVRPRHISVEHLMAGGQVFALWFSVSLAVVLLYNIVGELSSLKASPGKALVGLQVRTLTGDPLNLRLAIQRNMARLVPYFPVAILSYIFVSRRPDCADFESTLLVSTFFAIFAGSTLYYLAGLAILFSGGKRALHDHFADSQVVIMKDISTARMFFAMLLLLVSILVCIYYTP